MIPISFSLPMTCKDESHDGWPNTAQRWKPKTNHTINLPSRAYHTILHIFLLLLLFRNYSIGFISTMIFIKFQKIPYGRMEDLDTFEACE